MVDKNNSSNYIIMNYIDEITNDVKSDAMKYFSVEAALTIKSIVNNMFGVIETEIYDNDSFLVKFILHDGIEACGDVYIDGFEKNRPVFIKGAGAHNIKNIYTRDMLFKNTECENELDSVRRGIIYKAVLSVFVSIYSEILTTIIWNTKE